MVWCMRLTPHKTNENYNSNVFYFMIFGNNSDPDKSNDMLDVMKPLNIDCELIRSNSNNFQWFITLS